MIAPVPPRFALASALVDLWNHPYSGRRARGRCGDVLELVTAATAGREAA